MWTITFWRALAERALKTAAQTAVATIGTTAAFNAIDWRMVGLVVATATALSVLTSIASAATTDGSPSLNGAESLVYEPYPHAPIVTPTTTVSGGTTTYDPGDGTPPTTTLS